VEERAMKKKAMRMAEIGLTSGEIRLALMRELELACAYVDEWIEKYDSRVTEEEAEKIFDDAG
jgi:hypothetical protein